MSTKINRTANNRCAHWEEKINFSGNKFSSNKKLSSPSSQCSRNWNTPGSYLFCNKLRYKNWELFSSKVNWKNLNLISIMFSYDPKAVPNNLTSNSWRKANKTIYFFTTSILKEQNLHHQKISRRRKEEKITANKTSPSPNPSRTAKTNRNK